MGEQAFFLHTAVFPNTKWDNTCDYTEELSYVIMVFVSVISLFLLGKKSSRDYWILKFSGFLSDFFSVDTPIIMGAVHIKKHWREIKTLIFH